MNKDFFSVFYRISERIMYLVYINLLWILFSVVGLGILGIFPSTVAMFAVIRQQLKNDKTPAIKMYYTYFKKDFWKANAIGFIFVTLGYLLYLNINLVFLLEGNLAVIMFFVLILIATLFFLLISYFFPVFVHYDLNVRNCFVLSVVFIFSRPTHTVLIGIVSILNLYLIYHIPALIPFLGLSLWVFFVTHISQDAFNKSRPSTTA